MSWVDLAALVLILWCAVRGYLSGMWHAFLHLCAVVFSVLVSCRLQSSLLVYLDGEWQAEAKLVGFLARHVDYPLKTGGAELTVRGQSGLLLPLMQHWAPERIVPAGTQDAAVRTLASMILWALSLFLLFLVAAAILTLLLRIQKLRKKNQEQREWQKVGGLCLGAAMGMVLSTVGCLVLDALSFTSWMGFMQQDVANSYLYSVAGSAVKMILR
ncbi:MAG: CvpA family protein [Dethiobacter sp.]|jgi:hypothetical protein|nr:CvpA family protein [Dethiobacter sp.]